MVTQVEAERPPVLRKGARAQTVPTGPAERLFHRLHDKDSYFLRHPGTTGASLPADIHLLNAGTAAAGAIPPRVIAACREAAFALAIHRKLEPSLALFGLQKPLAALEQPLVAVLAKLEHRGMPLDASVLEEQIPELERVQAFHAAQVKATATAVGMVNFEIGGCANQQIPVCFFGESVCNYHQFRYSLQPLNFLKEHRLDVK